MRLGDENPRLEGEGADGAFCELNSLESNTEMTGFAPAMRPGAEEDYQSRELRAHTDGKGTRHSKNKKK